jgi:hypothetical protein
MRIPRVRFTVRRMIVAVAVTAIIALFLARSWERRSRLNDLAIARHVAALERFRVDDAAWNSGEITWGEIRTSLLALMEAERDLWGARVAARNHLARLRAYQAAVTNKPGLCYDPRFSTLVKSSVAEAEYWVAREE